MRVRVLGGGWYGCHLALFMMNLGHEVELHESKTQLFSGASGANPARLHRGFHYPRSRLTRAACLDHAEAFMSRYGHLTRAVPINLYAIAAQDSLVDFGNYRQTLAGEVEFITVERPEEFGLANVEGALLTGERHIVISQARAFFEEELEPVTELGRDAGLIDSPEWDLTLDCTFCALDAEAIDRYEPCVTGILEGPTDKAVTIMDGPFPSIYPWNEAEGLSSITSASLTPLSKKCRTYAEAKAVLDQLTPAEAGARVGEMLVQIAHFWPSVPDDYRLEDYRVGVRAMPRSGADARLVDVVRVGERALRIRAGKIDAVFRAEAMVLEMIR
jgi:hypothetical protein